MSLKFEENSVDKIWSSITITSNGASSNHTCKGLYSVVSLEAAVGAIRTEHKVSLKLLQVLYNEIIL